MDYILQDSNLKTFSIVYDNKDIESFLKRINGVYKRLNYIIQIDRKNNIKNEYIIHTNNGFITEYCLLYHNNKKQI